jgi:hypothetical protein
LVADYSSNNAHPGLIREGGVSDPDGDALTVVLVSPPSHGSLELNADGTFVYAPDDGFSGYDKFYFRYSDGFATTQIILASIFIRPKGINDSYTMLGNSVLAVGGSGVLQNDIGTSLTALLDVGFWVEAPSHGIIELNEDGSFTYTPNQGFHGVDTFGYWARSLLSGYGFSNVPQYVYGWAEVTIVVD